VGLAERILVGRSLVAAEQLRNGQVWSAQLHSMIMDCVLLQVPDRTEVDAMTFKEFPFTKALEDQYLPKGRFESALLELINY
jgi:2-oxoisovalerate dehydrogenase E1 component